MAVVVLVLWLFTAGAGFSLLVSSNLGRSRPAAPPVPATAPAVAETSPAASAAAPAPVSVASATPAASAAASAASPSLVAQAPAASKRELRRAARDRFDPALADRGQAGPDGAGGGGHCWSSGIRPWPSPAWPSGWASRSCTTCALGWIAFGLVTDDGVPGADVVYG